VILTTVAAELSRNVRVIQAFDIMAALDALDFMMEADHVAAG